MVRDGGGALDQGEQWAEASRVNFRKVEVLHVCKKDPRAEYGRGGTTLGRKTDGRDLAALLITAWSISHCKEGSSRGCTM